MFQKFHTFLTYSIIALLVVTPITPIFAIEVWELEDDFTTEGYPAIGKQPEKKYDLPAFPENADMQKLKNLMEKVFLPRPESDRWRYDCIYEGNFCPTYKYNSIAEAQIRMLVIHTYNSYPELYSTLFKRDTYWYDNDTEDTILTLEQVLERIPKASRIPGAFGNGSIAATLLNSSFHINEISYESSLQRALENEVEWYIRRAKWDIKKTDEVSVFDLLPTHEELYEETLFLNGIELRVGDIQDRFEYIITDDPEKPFIIQVPHDTRLYTIAEAKELLTQEDLPDIVYKDYSALLQGKTVPEIPHTFSLVPRDAMLLYIKNPKDFFSLIESDIKQSAWGQFASIQSVTEFITQFFGTSELSVIASQFQNEIIVIQDNIDVTAPDFAIVVSKNDRKHISLPAHYTEKEVGDFVIIGKSENFLNTLSALSKENSIAESSDFHFVWQKKAKHIETSFVFVGDAFFEKLISLEGFISHIRKLQAYTKLTRIQTFSWAYSDAFERIPSIADLAEWDTTRGNNIIFGWLEYTADYTILPNGVVQHHTYGSLQKLASIHDTQDSLTHITGQELDMYKAQVFNYREIWSSNLDPLGLIINKTDSGFDIDFYMTPLPASLNLSGIGTLLETIKKQTPDFLKKSQLQTGIASFSFAVDGNKLREAFRDGVEDEAIQEFIDFTQESTEFKEFLNIFDGEIALSFGGFHAPMVNKDEFDAVDEGMYEYFRSYNERPSVFVAISLTSPLKMQEFITQFLAQSGLRNQEGITKTQYKNHTIYSLEDMYFFEGFYTYIDNFLVVSLHKETLHDIIDNKTTVSIAQTIPGSILNAIIRTENLDSLAHASTDVLERYITPLLTQVGETRLVQEYNAFQWDFRLHGKTTKKTYSFLGTDIVVDTDGITIYTEKELAHYMPQDMRDFGKLDTFINTNSMLPEAFSVLWPKVFASMLQNYKDHPFLQNASLSLALGDNEIGFSIRVSSAKNINNTTTKNTDPILPILLSIGTLFLVIAGGFAYILSGRATTKETPH